MNVSVSLNHTKRTPTGCSGLRKQKISIRNLLENKLFPNCLPHVDIQQRKKNEWSKKKNTQEVDDVIYTYGCNNFNEFVELSI